MEKYTDKNGREIKAGDVLVYNEGDGYGQSIDEVIEHEGELATLIRVGEPKWTLIDDAEPVPLKFYKLFPEHADNVARDAEVADVVPEVAFTTKYAESVFGA